MQSIESVVLRVRTSTVAGGRRRCVLGTGDPSHSTPRREQAGTNSDDDGKPLIPLAKAAEPRLSPPVPGPWPLTTVTAPTGRVPWLRVRH